MLVWAHCNDWQSQQQNNLVQKPAPDFLEGGTRGGKRYATDATKKIRNNAIRASSRRSREVSLSQITKTKVPRAERVPSLARLGSKRSIDKDLSFLKPDPGNGTMGRCCALLPTRMEVCMAMEKITKSYHTLMKIKDAKANVGGYAIMKIFILRGPNTKNQDEMPR